MDVEAQDEGIMAKIMQPEGSKGVKVGSRIAVLAEPGDDLGSLSIPGEGTTSTTAPQEKTKSGIDPEKSSESQAEAPPSSKAPDAPPSSPRSSSASSPQQNSKTSIQPRRQTYPLYPSVAQLLHEKGVPTSTADKIPASGPKGRLLKGDVLAYLGAIEASYPSNQSARISKLGYLDLSNIKIALPKEMPGPPPETVKATPVPPQPEVDTEMAVTISLKAVREVQQRFHDVLGIDVPLSTFIARAADISNNELPPAQSSQPTSDELFDQVIGLDKVVCKTSRGSFTPQVTALPATPTPNILSKTLPKPDIIDLLTRGPPSSHAAQGFHPTRSRAIIGGSGVGAATNIFSVNAPNGQEKRAKVFLERMKTILQVEPGRLVIQ
ncbi:MAG: hypothetical protein Q9187_000244 [Circinaria calcarea]